MNIRLNHFLHAALNKVSIRTVFLVSQRLSRLASVVILVPVLLVQTAYAQPPTNTATPADNPAPESSTAAPAPVKAPIERYTPDINQNNRALLSQEITDGMIETLSANGEAFISIWEPDRSGAPYGAILIAHGDGQTADWPYTISTIRKSLPDFGWATLSIALPAPPLTSTFKGANNSPATPAEASKQKPPAMDDRVFARLKAAIDFLNNKGQFNIVILGHGEGASRSARYLSALQPNKTTTTHNPNARLKNKTKSVMEKPIRAFIMVNARNGQLNVPSNLINHLTDPNLPILDVYFGDHILDKTESIARKTAAKKHRHRAYHQIKLLIPTTIGNQGENRLTRRIRGFLNKYAKGVEVER